MPTDLTYEVKSRLAVLSTSKSGWTKELTLVSWNGGEPKYDIRTWSPDHSTMGKGVTLDKEEMEALKEFLDGGLEIRQ